MVYLDSVRELHAAVSASAIEMIRTVCRKFDNQTNTNITRRWGQFLPPGQYPIIAVQHLNCAPNSLSLYIDMLLTNSFLASARTGSFHSIFAWSHCFSSSYSALVTPLLPNRHTPFCTTSILGNISSVGCYGSDCNIRWIDMLYEEDIGQPQRSAETNRRKR